MQKFDTPAPISAVLDIPAGRVQFIAADRADTTVEVLPANAAKSRDVRAAERIEVAYGDGVLRIEAPEAKNQYFGASGAVEVTVQLPAGSRVEGKAAAADLRGVGRLGDVAFEGAQGPVKLDEAASVRLSLHDGDVTVGRLGARRRSAPSGATSGSPRQSAARSSCAPGWATSRSTPPAEPPPPWMPAPATAASRTRSRTPTATPPT